MAEELFYDLKKTETGIARAAVAEYQIVEKLGGFTTTEGGIDTNGAPGQFKEELLHKFTEASHGQELEFGNNSVDQQTYEEWKSSYDSYRDNPRKLEPISQVSIVCQSFEKIC